MSMRVHDAATACYSQVQHVATTTVAWIGKTVSTVATYFSELVSKIAEFVKPYFDKAMSLAKNNQATLLITAAVVTTVGVVAYFANSFFNEAVNAPVVVTNAEHGTTTEVPAGGTDAQLPSTGTDNQ
jgi:hypothetical protein